MQPMKLILLLNLIFLSHSSDDFCSNCGQYPESFKFKKSSAYNGEDSKYAPWTVYIKINKKSVCSGSIIGNKYIVSAAHCFNAHRLSNLNSTQLASIVKIYGGFLKKDLDEFVTLKPEHIFIHPDFKIEDLKDPHTNTYNDLAIIKLIKPIVISSKIKPICIGIGAKVNDGVIVQGYGIDCIDKKRDKKFVASKELKQVDLVIQSDEKCRKLNGDKITEKHICAKSYANKETVCPGNSGGPLFRIGRDLDSGETRAYLVGVTSYGGEADGQPLGYPVVFTKIKSYFEWIQYTTGIKPVCEGERLMQEIIAFYENND